MEGFLLESISMLGRWGHYLFGIAWIGLLYYFNFVQGAFLAGASDAVKVDVFTRLMPRALGWFRYAALFTFLTGVVLLLLMFRGGLVLLPVDIVVSSVMATLMFLNVWLIIWPQQSVVIKSHESVRDGGEADPGAADAAAKALLASRTNVLLSAPMLALMMTNAHFPLGAPHSHHGHEPHIATGSMAICLIIVALIEINAIWGRPGPLLRGVGAVIASSVALAFILNAIIGIGL